MKFVFPQKNPLEKANTLLKTYPNSKITIQQDDKMKIVDELVVEFSDEEEAEKFISEHEESNLVDIDVLKSNSNENSYCRFIIESPQMPKLTLDAVEKYKYKKGFILPLLKVGTEVAVFIPHHFLSFSNENVQNYNLFGTDIYTDDSDAVCMAIHAGHFKPLDKSPFSSELRGDNRIGIKNQITFEKPHYPNYHLIIVFQVVYPLKTYHHSFRNLLPSRGFACHDGNSLYIAKSHKVNFNK